MVVNLQHWMLRTARQHIIEQKWAFEGAIIAFAKALPDPDQMECNYANVPVLKRIRDKFMGYLRVKHDLYWAFWRIVIDEMDHDPDHRAMLEFILEEVIESVMEGEWKPREVGWPGPTIWGEPRTANEGNYGGFRGRRFKQLIKK
jgi:hypothetical protein